VNCPADPAGIGSGAGRQAVTRVGISRVACPRVGAPPLLALSLYRRSTPSGFAWHHLWPWPGLSDHPPASATATAASGVSPRVLRLAPPLFRPGLSSVHPPAVRLPLASISGLATSRVLRLVPPLFLTPGQILPPRVLVQRNPAFLRREPSATPCHFELIFGWRQRRCRSSLWFALRLIDRAAADAMTWHMPSRCA
jgi:hypothetical protein